MTVLSSHPRFWLLNTSPFSMLTRNVRWIAIKLPYYTFLGALLQNLLFLIIKYGDCETKSCTGEPGNEWTQTPKHFLLKLLYDRVHLWIKHSSLLKNGGLPSLMLQSICWNPKMFDGMPTVHARLEFSFFVTSSTSSRVIEVIDALVLPILRVCDLPDVEVIIHQEYQNIKSIYRIFYRQSK